MNIVLLGPPGAGRGTQASLLEKKYRIPKISTGDIFQKELWHESDLGKKIRGSVKSGQMLPDALVNHLVFNHMQATDCSRGFVLDGYPRTVTQAQALDHHLSVTKQPLHLVLLLELDASILTDRLAYRRVCPKGHGEWNIRLRPSKLGNQCEVCKSTLVQREDDNPQSIRNRLLMYAKNIESLKKYFGGRNIIRSVDAQGSPDETTRHIEAAMGEVPAVAENKHFKLPG